MKPKKGSVQKWRSQKDGGAVPASAVHELNNLLTLVLGYSQLIIDGSKRNDANRHHAVQILKAGESAAELTRLMADAIGSPGAWSSPRGASRGGKPPEGNGGQAEAPVQAPSRRVARRG